MEGIKDEQLVLEGREAQLYPVLLTAGVALSWSDPGNYELGNTIWQITKSVFSYQELMGVEAEELKDQLDKLKLAHEAGMAILQVADIEALIFGASTITEKIKLMIEYRAELAATSKLQVLEEVISSSDLGLKVAVAELLNSTDFATEPAELRAMVERALELEEREVPLSDIKVLARLAQMSRFEQVVYKLHNFDESATNQVLDQVYKYLEEWGIV